MGAQWWPFLDLAIYPRPSKKQASKTLAMHKEQKQIPGFQVGFV